MEPEWSSRSVRGTTIHGKVTKQTCFLATQNENLLEWKSATTLSGQQNHKWLTWQLWPAKSLRKNTQVISRKLKDLRLSFMLPEEEALQSKSLVRREHTVILTASLAHYGLLATKELDESS